MTIRVVLVHAFRLHREALRALLATAGDIEVVGDAGSGCDALALVKQFTPDIVVLVGATADLDGNEIARRLRENGTATKVLAFCEPNDRRCAQDLLRSGAA